MLVLAGSHLAGPGGRAPSGDLIHRALRTMLAACRGTVLLGSDRGVDLGQPPDGAFVIEALDADRAAKAVAAALLERRQPARRGPVRTRAAAVGHHIRPSRLLGEPRSSG